MHKEQLGREALSLLAFAAGQTLHRSRLSMSGK